MRRVLDRYLFLECLPTLLLSVTVFTFVLLMHRLLKLSDLVVAKGVPLLEVLRLLVLALPALMPLLLPVSLLLAVLLAVGRLSADSEIVAMRACGVGLAQNLRPVMWLSGLTLLVTAWISLWAQPHSARAFKEFLYESVKNRIGITAQSGVFTELTRGITVYADDLSIEGGAMGNLFLRLEDDEMGNVWILAESGTVTEDGGDLRLDLHNGEMHQRTADDGSYRVLRFRRYRLRVPLPAASWSVGEEETPTPVLWRQAYSTGEQVDARLELHRRFALPVACLVFGVLGAALGLHHARGGKSRGVTVCLVILLLYYALLTAGKGMGQRGVLPPELAMWMPNLVLGALAAYAFVRKNREAPLPLENELLRAAAHLRHRMEQLTHRKGTA